jgi:general stress protein CsbA
MIEKLVDMFMDIAKYLATGLIIAFIYHQLKAGNVLTAYLVGGAVIVVGLALGLYLHSKNEKNKQEEEEDD